MPAPEPASEAFGFVVNGPRDPEPTNADAFRDDIAVGESVVEFWAARCSACRRIAPWLSQWQRESVQTVKTFTVNVDEELEAAIDAGVRIAPTLVRYRDGREVGRLEGAVDQPGLEAWLASSPESLPDV
jgi:thioredoxin-like negative regulator of GroEL